MKRSIRRFLLALVGLLILAACGGQGSPAATIESYLKVRLAGDVTKLVALSCKAWESSATDEANSFKSLNATLDGVKCAQQGDDGGFSLVVCQGKVTINYVGEAAQTRDLATRAFKTTREDGQWKMCGYAALK